MASLDENILEAAGRIRALLRSLDSGTASPSAYDTAWIARIQHEGRPMYPQCVEWLRRNQSPDGSWGDVSLVEHYDRILCTLNSAIALKLWGKDEKPVARGEDYIRRIVAELPPLQKPGIGLQMLLSGLASTAANVGLDIPYSELQILALHARGESSRTVTEENTMWACAHAEHALEMLDVPFDGVRLELYQASDGSFFHSPAATAFMYIQTGHPRCLEYIRCVLQENGDWAPSCYPIGVMGRLHALCVISELMLEPYFDVEIRKQLDSLMAFWRAAAAEDSGFSSFFMSDVGMWLRVLRDRGRGILLHSSVRRLLEREDVLRSSIASASIIDLGKLLEGTERSTGEPTLARLGDVVRERLRVQAREVGLVERGPIREHWSVYVHWLAGRRFLYAAPLVDRQSYVDFFPSRVLWMGRGGCGREVGYSSAFRELAVLDQQKMKHLFQRELDELHDWARRYLDPRHVKRVVSSHFVACNVAPFSAQSEARKLFTKSTLWLFGVDEFFDNQDISLSDVESIVMMMMSREAACSERVCNPQYREMAIRLLDALEVMNADAIRWQGEDATEYLERILHENLVLGNLAERLVRERGETPALDEYLAYGRFSIGVRFVLSYAFLGMSNLSVEQLQSNEFFELAQLSAELIRIVNDVRSYDKELGEGKTNSVGIVMAEAGLDEEGAVDYLMTERYEKPMAELYEGCFRESSLPQEVKRLAFDLCRTTAWFYQANDFHLYHTTISSFFEVR